MRIRAAAEDFTKTGDLKEVPGEKESMETEVNSLIGRGFDNDYEAHTKKSKIGKDA